MNEKAPEMLALLKNVIELESPSLDKETTDKLSAFLKAKFAGLGARTEFIPQTDVGDHVRVEWGEGDEQVLVLCHMDTVWAKGEVEKRPFKIEDGKAFGPGAMDMKGGIVQAFLAMKALVDLGIKPSKRIVVLLNTDEEIGSPTSRPIIEEEAKKSRCVFVLEPPVGTAIKTFRKGVGMFRVKATGRPAHAGADPEKGISAIGEMAHQVLKLHALNNRETGTTVNVGVINGGTRSNVVAAECNIQVDLRVKSAVEAERVVPEIMNLKPVLEGAKLEVTGGMNRPPMERTPKIVEMYQKAKSLAAELGFDLPETGTGGGSDGNFTAALGVPTLDGLGSVGEGGHGPVEFVIAEHMPQRAALLTRLFETI